MNHLAEVGEEVLQVSPLAEVVAEDHRVPQNQEGAAAERPLQGDQGVEVGVLQVQWILHLVREGAEVVLKDHHDRAEEAEVPRRLAGVEVEVPQYLAEVEVGERQALWEVEEEVLLQ